MIRHSEKEVLREVNRLKKRGHSNNGIKNKLRKQGLKQSLIDKGIKHHTNRHKHKKETIHKIFGKVESNSKVKYEERKAPELIIVFILFVLGLSILSVLLTSSPLCKDEGCFLEKSNDCENVIFYKKINNVLFSFHSNECTVIKRVERVDFSGEIGRLMKGKEMSCFYNKEEFDESLLDSLGGDLDKCSGEYKNVYISVINN